MNPIIARIGEITAFRGPFSSAISSPGHSIPSAPTLNQLASPFLSAPYYLLYIRVNEQPSKNGQMKVPLLTH